MCVHVCACVCMCVRARAWATAQAQLVARHRLAQTIRRRPRHVLVHASFCVFMCVHVCVCRVAGTEPESLSLFLSLLLCLSLRVPGAEPDAAQDGAAAPREELLTAGRRTSTSCYPLAARRYSSPAGVPAGAIARLLVCVCVCVCVCARARVRVCVCVVCGRVVDDGGRVLAVAGSGPLQ
jgi:hypothetical protein